MATLTRTPRQMIVGALRALSVHGQNQDVDNEQMADALEQLNEILSQHSVRTTYVPYHIQENFTLSSGTESYTIGSGATFNTDRPKRITGGFIRDSSGLDYPLDLMTRDTYNLIEDKDRPGRPTALYYRDAYPNGTVYFDYAPETAETAYLDLIKPIGNLTLATLDTAISIPPDHFGFVRYSLALAMAPEYDVGTTKMNQINALRKDAEKSVMIANAEVFETDFDSGLEEAMI